MIRRAWLAVVLMASGCAQHAAEPSVGVDSGPDATSNTGGAATGRLALAAVCAADADCASGVCLRQRCATACTGAADCPPAPEWTCALTPERGTNCQCAPSGSEVCDGRDNDCNDQVDDAAVCPGLFQCNAGACVCPAEFSCGSACVDRSSDSAHCGACDTACPIGAVCEAGSCKCPASSVLCTGACADLDTDSDHCGACDVACSALERCDGGRCVCAHTLCPAGCTDLDSDPHACGSCGHDCLGGECLDGWCQPIRIVAENDTSVAATDTEVFWISDTHDVKKASIDGSGSVTLAKGEPITGIVPMAVDGSHVYWVSDTGIRRAPRDGSAAAIDFVPGAPAAVFAFDSVGRLYFTAYDVVARVDADGNNLVFLATNQSYAEGLAVDATHVYFASSVYFGRYGSVRRMTLDGADLETLAVSEPPRPNDYTPSSVAVDESYLYFNGLYWAGPAPGSIFRAGHDGLDRYPIAHCYVRKMLVDATTLYWVGGDEFNLAGAVAMPKAGGSTRVLAHSVEMWDIAQNATAVFFTVHTAQGGIYRVAK